MSEILQTIASNYPSSHAGSYLYRINPVDFGGTLSLAVISSADEVLLLDADDISRTPTSLSDTPKGVTSLATGEVRAKRGRELRSVIACAGQDGVVALYDVGATHTHRQVTIEQERPISALALNMFDLAVGTELSQHETVVSVWDMRNPSRKKWQTTEISDDITTLAWSPLRSSFLLAGSIDGTVNIFETMYQDPEDSLLQAANHGPIHRAGFMEQNHLYALSSDEQLSIHFVTAGFADEDLEEPNDLPTGATMLGDLRPKLGCEYVVDVVDSGGPYFVAAGTHSSNPHIDLIPITTEGKLKTKKQVTLDGAHGEEIVRDIYADVETTTAFSVGEDGFVRAWRGY